MMHHQKPSEQNKREAAMLYTESLRGNLAILRDLPVFRGYQKEPDSYGLYM